VIKNDFLWIGLKNKLKKRRDMFKDLGGISELTLVLNLLQLEEYNQ